MIPDGSNVTYVGTWSYDPFSFTAADTVNTVLQDLVGVGLVSRAQPQIGGGGFVAAASGGTFQVTLQLQVENGVGFSTPDDLISLIRHAVYSETNHFPSADSLPYVQVPGGTTAPTGQPSPAAVPQSGCLAGSSNDTTGSFSLSCWVKNLTTTGLSTVGVLALLALAAFGLIIFYGPRRQ